MNIKSYVWVLPFLSFLCGYGFLHYVFQVQSIEMPDLVGKTIEQVMPVVTELNLNMRLLHYIEDADISPGTVLSQIPIGKQKIKPYQSVFLVIARQPPGRYAPDVRTHTEDDMVKELALSGIAPQMYHVPSHYPLGHCIAQMPVAGELLHASSMIVYLSDNGTEKTIWPNFMKKRIEDVSEFLRSHDIVIEKIHTYAPQPHHECTHCVVVDQRPLPGSIISLNTPGYPLKVQFQVE